MYGDPRVNTRAPPPFLSRLARALSGLLTPSKPQISSLTMIAGDEPHLSAQIADMISDELLRRAPIDRLPVLYLMDSIVKNLGGQYIPLFARRLPLLVLSTYDGLRPDHPIRSSIMRLVDSWRDARSFPVELVIDLKRRLLEPPPPIVPRGPPSRRPPSPVMMTRAPPPHMHRRAMPDVPPPKRIRRMAPARPLSPQLHDLLANSLDQYQTLSSQDKHVPPPVSVPTAPDFSSDSLRSSPLAAIAALYSNIPLQCEYCALRIRTKEEMANHLDWHFKTNREMKKREKTTSSQLWFMSVDDWVNCSGEDEREAPPSYFDQKFAAHEALAAAKEPEQKVSTVVADDERPNCSTCGEPFERFWDDNAEAWMFKDAVNLGSDLIHMFCLDDKKPAEESI